MYNYAIIRLNYRENTSPYPFKFPFEQEFPAKKAHLSTGSELSTAPAHAAQVQIRRRK